MFQKIASLFQNQQGGGIHSGIIRNKYQKTLKAIAFLFCVIFFVFLPVGFSGVSKAEAAIYYVNGSGAQYAGTQGIYQLGNDSTGDGSLSAPWATPWGVEVRAGVLTGDIIYVAAADYTNAVAGQYWSSSKGISWIADGAVTIHGNGTASRTMQIDENSNAGSWTGLTFDGDGKLENISDLGSTNRVFTNCIFIDISNAGNHYAVASAVAAPTFTNCTFTIANGRAFNGGNITDNGSTFNLISNSTGLFAGINGWAANLNFTNSIINAGKSGVILFDLNGSSTSNFIGVTVNLNAAIPSIIDAARNAADNGIINWNNCTVGGSNPIATTAEMFKFATSTFNLSVNGGNITTASNQSSGVWSFDGASSGSQTVNFLNHTISANGGGAPIAVSSSGSTIVATINGNSITSDGTTGYLIAIGTENTSINDNKITANIYNNRLYGENRISKINDIPIVHAILKGYNKGGMIYKNYIVGNGYGIVTKHSNGSGTDTELIYDNILINNKAGILVKGQEGVTIVNNTIVSLYDYTAGSIPYGIQLDDNSGAHAPVNTVLKNNIIYLANVGGAPKGIFWAVAISSDFVSNDNLIYVANNGNVAMIGLDNETWTQWQALNYDNAGVNADSRFINMSNNYALQSTSPAIDSGIPISGITTDYLGNHIYGNPDIGAYEYQPPYTITIDNPNISSPIRIYADGKYRYTTTTSGSTNAKLSITPQAGFGTGDYSQWMDVSIDTWHTSSDYYKKWTESSTNHTLTTNHTIGDLEPNTYYTLKIDTNNQNTYLSNSSGQITFTYSGGYSTHTFEITEDTTSPASFTLISPTTNTTTSNRTPTFSWNASSDTESNLSKYQFYLDGIIDTDNISNITTSILPTNILSCGNHTWYIKAIDNNNNITNSNTFTLDINCAGAFIPSPKPIVTPTDPTLGTAPSNITQIAISRTPDFTNTSWQPFDKDKFKNIDQTTETLYVKFRTDQGAVSDTIIYTPQAANQSTTVTLTEGDIVKTLNNPDVYVIKYKNNKQYKRLILSPLVFKSYQHLKWENIKIISQEQLDKYTTSNLVKETIDTIIYQLFPNGDTGERKAQDTSINYDTDSVYEINGVDRDSYKLVK